MSAREPLALVVAMNKAGVIGKEGGLPWHVSEDLKHVKRITTGHAIIMGRRTYDSIGRPLPNRLNIVVSRRPGLQIEGCEVVPDVATAIRRAREWGDDEPRIFGGASLYREALADVTRIFLTEVDIDVEGADTFFPVWNRDEWVEEERTPGEDPRVVFRTLVRKTG